MRYAIGLALILALMSGLAAQTTVNLNGDVPDDRIHFYLFDVDHGVAPTAIDITVNLTATGSSGLDVTIYDLNEWAAIGPLYEINNFVFPNGPVTATLSLPSRTGVHQVLVALEIDSASGNTPYTGTTSVNMGTIAQADFQSALRQEPGLQNIVDRVLNLITNINQGATLHFDMTLDFGVTSHSTDFQVRVGAQGTGTTYRLLNMSTTPPTVVRSVVGSGGLILDEQTFSFGPHTGVVTYRIEVLMAVPAGLVTSKVIIGSGVTLTNATVTTIPPAPTKKKKKSDDCSVSPTEAGWPGVAILAVLAALGVTQRRRHAKAAIN